MKRVLLVLALILAAPRLSTDVRAAQSKCHKEYSYEDATALISRSTFGQTYTTEGFRNVCEIVTFDGCSVVMQLTAKSLDSETAFRHTYILDLKDVKRVITLDDGFGEQPFLVVGVYTQEGKIRMSSSELPTGRKFPERKEAFLAVPAGDRDAAHQIQNAFEGLVASCQAGDFKRRRTE